MDGVKPYMKIKEAVKATGLSAHFLRKGCWDGTVPHIKVGNVYYINTKALLEKLNEETVWRG